MSIYQALKDYQEVITRGDYLVFDAPVSCRFVGRFFRFENQTAMKPSLTASVYVNWVEEGAADLTLKHVFNRTLARDAFTLTISEDKELVIESQNLRGFRYAQEALEKVMTVKEGRLYLPIVSVRHSPSFAMRGVIEGFYGTPWTREERLDCLSFIADKGMNTYMYAPKNDDYQRSHWREPYPEDWVAHFKDLIQLAKERQVDFWYMISPGLDFDYTKEEDYQLLYQKLQQLLDLGVCHFGLLLDDIDYQIVAAVERRFKKTAYAQAHLATAVYQFLQRQHAAPDLVVCPTEYDNHHDSLYLAELSEAIPAEVAFFWTGPSTLASQISQADIETMAAIYRRPIIIWDNIPVNDYQNDFERLFLTPFANRSPFLCQPDYQVRGIVSNPMISWELSKPTLIDMSHYLWDAKRYQPSYSWLEALRDYTGDKAMALALLRFAWHNGNRHLHRDLPFEVEEALMRKDIASLSGWVAELVELVDKLKELDIPAFQQAIAPWFDRARADRSFWRAILEQMPDLEQQYAELQEQRHRIGSNIPSRFYQLHYLQEDRGLGNQVQVAEARAEDYT
ncbi:TPA: beta-N-acetylglucosaminidase domain-containing protein [Streptococcus equi subsp. zooepidemicus]|uniref:beta-N-acetylglucosaminidase domain-containing protein n=1 Tax=Streptococcus equi TaxID=1336 RepID=UPI000DA2CBAF|nr:beta-N-acetylglucosaminidase [Streptococcus equi subsp. zooepidemicus]VED86072.1 beta-N-acetylglucosaminidase [Streptococcus equi subsp. equi]HEL0009910.1 beta-N-acetylglucosaminidase domain-containing protein [Streptococcus equi subsp. zooepidemicus]HEL0011984.1 beta-N-acetylglucosaminidase domain-containing protein [Streptococcus equi subsp. zooepidemicus]HEL0013994.1 beta-N-acetylglucosaminidase domain-containing protein [Streptococcus equi subsp. zooepidemicus]